MHHTLCNKGGFVALAGVANKLGFLKKVLAFMLPGVYMPSVLSFDNAKGMVQLAPNPIVKCMSKYTTPRSQ